MDYMKNLYDQLESLFFIKSILDDNLLLPKLRGWAASPDFIYEIYKEILLKLKQKKNIAILEIGSGSSTIFISSLLKKKNINARFISIDHNYEFLKKTMELIKLSGLNKFVSFVHAPFKYYLIEDKEWIFYDISSIKGGLGNFKIDILIVDGPPATTQELARYPAIPLLKDFFDKEITILLDDANRDDEKKIANLWLKELENSTLEFLPTEKGTAKIEVHSFEKKPFISICIPTYNRKKYLLESLNSVKNLNYKNLEVVIVDDGSEDGTEELVSNFKDQIDIPIKYHKNEKNMGRPYSRNKCIELADGEYILWLDDDDILEADCISAYLKTLNELNMEPDVVYGNLLTFSEYEDTQKYMMSEDFWKANNYLLIRLLESSPIPNPGVLVKRDLYEKYGKYNVSFYRAQDYEFWSRIGKNAKFKKVEKLVVNYRIHPDNISNISDTTNVDTSFESRIKRNMLNLYSITDFSPFDTDEKIFFKMSEVLKNILDINNSILYSYLAFKKTENKEYLWQIFKLAIFGGYEHLSDKFLELLKSEYKKDKEKSFYIKLYKRKKLREFFSEKNSFYFFMEKAKELMNENKVKAYNFSRTALIINPFNIEVRKLCEKLLGEEETKNIIDRLITPANKYEEEFSLIRKTLGIYND